MSLVSTRLSLIHQCTIERDATSATDGWGDKGVANWQPLASAVPCRLWARAGREAVNATTVAVIEDLRMLLAADTDITEKDRIGDVVYRGTTLLTGPVGIRAVLRRSDHLELVLVRIA